MKARSLAILVVLSVGAGAVTAPSADADERADKVQQKLQGLLAKAKQGLAWAQRHHGKVVAQSRKKAELFLEAEAKAVGGAVVRYADDLEKAESQMTELLAAAEAKVAEQKKKSGMSGTMSGDLVSDEVRLG